MIHHLSLPANDPRLVATTLARLMSGSAYPFPVWPGGWMATKNDEIGTAIEVIPSDIILLPGVGDAPLVHVVGPQTAPHEVRFERAQGGPHALHLAMSVPLDEEDVHAIAKELGWRCITCFRGGVFHVIELWVENHTLIEVMTPQMAGEYTAFMRPESVRQFLGEPVAA